MRLSLCHRAEIIGRYRAGESAVALGLEFGVSDSTIRYWGRPADAKHPRTTYKETDAQKKKHREENPHLYGKDGRYLETPRNQTQERLFNLELLARIKESRARLEYPDKEYALGNATHVHDRTTDQREDTVPLCRFYGTQRARHPQVT